MSRVEDDDRQALRGEGVPEPDGQRSGLHADLLELMRPAFEPMRDGLGAGCDLPLGQDRAAVIDDADRRLLLRDVQSCENAHVILHRASVGTDQ